VCPDDADDGNGGDADDDDRILKSDRMQADLSLLSDSSGMGEQFTRLQRMYERVQGKKH
jgi:hypothetical protein